MICPYCDSRVKDLPDNHVCPHCGAPLAGVKKAKSQQQAVPQLESYYQRYKPDRIRAIMALRIDTGMDPMRAQKVIDLIFDFHESKGE